MKFSALYQTYDAMREPNYALNVGGKSLDVGDDARLTRVECELTCTRQAGVLALEEPDGGVLRLPLRRALERSVERDAHAAGGGVSGCAGTADADFLR